MNIQVEIDDAQIKAAAKSVNFLEDAENRKTVVQAAVAVAIGVPIRTSRIAPQLVSEMQEGKGGKHSWRAVISHGAISGKVCQISRCRAPIP